MSDCRREQRFGLLGGLLVIGLLILPTLHAANAIKVESTTAEPGAQDILVRILIDHEDPIMGLSFAGQYDDRLTFDRWTVEGTLFGPDQLDADYVQTIAWGNVFGVAVVIELPDSLEDPYLQKTLPAGTDQYVLGAIFDMEPGVPVGTELTLELRDDLRSTADPGSPAVAPVFTVAGQTVTPDLFSGTITVAAPPSITAVDPADGPTAGGTSVTITGANFTSDITVTFGGQPLQDLTVVDQGTIKGTTPPHAAGAVDVVVSNSFGSDTLEGGFTYHAPPAITAINPASGPADGGTAVTITGTGFTPDAVVTLDGQPLQDVTVSSETTIQGVTPAHAPGPVDVTVTTAYGSDTLEGGFTYEEVPPPPPTISSVSPNEGPGDEDIVITGTNFTPDASVSFGGTPCTDVVVVSETEIHCHIPACGGTTDWVPIAVTTPGGTARLEEGYRCVPAIVFVRGNANCDQAVDIGDAIAILSYLFSGKTVSCLDALDSNDDGKLDIADAIYLLGYLFSSTAPPPDPFPEAGVDPTPDDLGCDASCGV